MMKVLMTEMVMMMKLDEAMNKEGSFTSRNGVIQITVLMKT